MTLQETIKYMEVRAVKSLGSHLTVYSSCVKMGHSQRGHTVAIRRIAKAKLLTAGLSRVQHSYYLPSVSSL